MQEPSAPLLPAAAQAPSPPASFSRLSTPRLPPATEAPSPPVSLSRLSTPRRAGVPSFKAPLPSPGSSGGGPSGCGWAALQPLLIVGIIFLAGMLTTVQTSINTRAGDHFGSFMYGCTINFVFATLFLIPVVLIERLVVRELGGRGLLRWTRRPAAWQFLPGAIGVTFVSAGAALAGRIGFAVFFIACVVGQLAASILLDRYGWVGSPKLGLPRHKVLALVLAIAGSVVSVYDQLGSATSSTSTGLFLLYVVLAIGAAALLPFQAAINRTMAELLPSRLQATLFSFLIGSCAALVGLGIQLAAQPGLASRLPSDFASASWWMFFGGPGGIVYIATAIFFLRVVGAALYFVSLVCGQMTGSLVLDSVGFLGSPKHAASAALVCGVLLVIVSAIVMQFGPLLYKVAAGLLSGKGSRLTKSSSSGALTTALLDDSARAGMLSSSPLLRGLSAGSGGSATGFGFVLDSGSARGSASGSRRSSTGSVTSLSSMALGEPAMTLVPAGATAVALAPPPHPKTPPPTPAGPPRSAAISIPRISLGGGMGSPDRSFDAALYSSSATRARRTGVGGEGGNDDSFTIGGGSGRVGSVPPSPALSAVLAPGSPSFSRLMASRGASVPVSASSLAGSATPVMTGRTAGGGASGGIAIASGTAPSTPRLAPLDPSVFMPGTPSSSFRQSILGGGLRGMSPARPVSLSVSLAGRIGLDDAGEESNLL